MDNNDLTTGLTSNMKDFFANDEENSKTAPVLGGLGAGILHTVVVALLIYSGYHGIHATRRYRDSQGLGNAAGIIGILIIEFVMLGLYLAYFYRRITGETQKYLAAATFGIGVILVSMGIVGDSLMQAGRALPSWLETYLSFGLPLAPVIMAIGAGAVMAAEPKLTRQIKAALKREDFAEKSHTARMKAQDAKLTVAQNTANVQLNALDMTGQYVLAAYRTPEVQAFIQQAALANLPEVLRGAGILLPYGTVIEGQTVEPLPAQPAAPEEPAAATTPPRPSLFARFRRQPAPAAPNAEERNSTHDAARQDNAPTADPPAGQGGPAAMSDEDMKRFIRLLREIDRESAAAVGHPNGQEKPDRPS